MCSNELSPHQHASMRTEHQEGWYGMKEQNRILVWCLVNVNVSQPVPSCFFVSLISDDGNWIKTNFHFLRLAFLLSCPDPHTHSLKPQLIHWAFNMEYYLEHSVERMLSRFIHFMFFLRANLSISIFRHQTKISLRLHEIQKAKIRMNFYKLILFVVFFSGARLGHIQKDFHSNGFRSSSPSSLFARCAIFRSVGSPTNNAQLLIAFLLCSSHNISLINWNIFFAPFFCASSSPVHADSTLWFARDEHIKIEYDVELGSHCKCEHVVGLRVVMMCDCIRFLWNSKFFRRHVYDSRWKIIILSNRKTLSEF